MHAGFGGRLPGKGHGSCTLNPGPRRAAHPTMDLAARTGSFRLLIRDRDTKFAGMLDNVFVS
jgi:hypothetical protein